MDIVPVTEKNQKRKREILGPPGRDTKAQHQHIIVRGKANAKVTFSSMIVYGIRLSPNDYVPVLCFGIPIQEVPIFPFSAFDFFRLPGQYPL